MSPTDPPLPPSPDEPTEEPQWAGGEPNGAPGAGEQDGLEPPESDGGSSEPGEAIGEEPVPPLDADSIGDDGTAVLPPTGDEPTEVLPPTDDVPTEVPTGDEPTEVLPPTGDEPTEVLLGATAVSDGTGETTREHRRRVSQRRYVMRRLGVSLAALAIAGGGVLLLVALFGDDDDPGGAGTDTTTPISSEAVVAPSTTKVSTTTASPETSEAIASATTAAVESSEPGSGGDPATTAGPDETDPPEQTDPVGEGSDSTVATESSPPGTVVYDLDSEATCEIGQPLRRGDAGPQVQCLQERLNEVTVGGADYVVDGAFGEQTEDAVRAFQAANELGVDGIVGPATGELLGIWAG